MGTEVACVALEIQIPGYQYPAQHGPAMVRVVPKQSLLGVTQRVVTYWEREAVGLRADQLANLALDSGPS